MRRILFLRRFPLLLIWLRTSRFVLCLLFIFLGWFAFSRLHLRLHSIFRTLFVRTLFVRTLFVRILFVRTLFVRIWALRFFFLLLFRFSIRRNCCSIQYKCWGRNKLHYSIRINLHSLPRHGYQRPHHATWVHSGNGVTSLYGVIKSYVAVW